MFDAGKGEKCILPGCGRFGPSIGSSEISKEVGKGRLVGRENEKAKDPLASPGVDSEVPVGASREVEESGGRGEFIL